MQAFEQQPYNGVSTKLCLAFDVGTSFSSISYCILNPGQVPVIRNVNRFPRQHHADRIEKVPSVIYYDQGGNLCAVGAEIQDPDTNAEAADEGWIKVAWFKLLFGPKKTAKLCSHSPLPPNKTKEDVLSDYLQYLYDCSREFIEDAHPDGVFLWKSLHGDAQFILSHPATWGGKQHDILRTCMAQSGLLPDPNSDRLAFVSEGEANLHYIMRHRHELGLNGDRKGDGVLVFDAGAGTIDISSYNIIQWSPVVMEEMNIPESLVFGSHVLAVELRAMLDRVVDKREALRMYESFEQFTSSPDDQRTEEVHPDVAQMFDSCISALVQAINVQRQGNVSKLRTAFFLGGLSLGSRFYEKLISRLRFMRIRVFRPEHLLGHAVSEGSISSYLNNQVIYRVAKFTYGVKCTREFEHNDPEHQRRRRSAFVNPSGKAFLPHGYQAILKKGMRVSRDREFSWVFVHESNRKEETTTAPCEIICYAGELVNPQWTDVEPDKYKTLCTIRADVSNVPIFPLKRSPIHFTPEESARPFYRQKFWVVLSFGMTEMKAEVKWFEGNEERRSPAKVIYEE